MFRVMRDIQNKEGFLALFKGLSASMLGISHVLIYFPLYERTKQMFRNMYNLKETDNLGAKNVFLSAVISKSITTSITYPHEVMRARQ